MVGTVASTRWLFLFEVDQRDPDGTMRCLGVDVQTEQPYFIAGIGTYYFDAAEFAEVASGHACPSSPVDLGTEAVRFDCTEDGYSSFTWRLTPQAIADTYPDGGLQVSVDIRTDMGDGADQPLLLENLREPLSDLDRAILQRSLDASDIP